ncbi:MAG TPA: trigger factor [Thermodesulfovibrionales bacterium]|nr:trigger factor [Thermodesulfovibrionales bacterium]
MIKALEDISATKKRLRIEIPADMIEQEIRDSLEKLRRKTTIPGFRTGKAPIDLIEKRFGKEVESDVLERIIPMGYVDALREANITPVANPVLEEKSDFKRKQPISMTLTVEVMPSIENLKYEEIPLKDIPVAVSDADVESVLRRQQEEKATYEPSGGPVEVNDLIVVDYSSEADGVEAKDQIVKVGGSMFPEEFTQKVLGKGKGEELSVEASFPEDHPLEHLAGKHLTLKVKINDIKKVNLPAVDDELAKDIGFQSLEEMRKRIGEEIEKAKRNEVAKIQKAEIIRNLVESHEFDIPESLVERETEVLASAALSHKGGTEPTDQERDTLKQEVRANAVRNVKASLLIETIGKAQGVSVAEDEVKRAIVSLAQRLSVSPEQIMKFYVSKDGSLEGLKGSLFEEKVLDLILSKAKLEKGE